MLPSAMAYSLDVLLSVEASFVSVSSAVAFEFALPPPPPPPQVPLPLLLLLLDCEGGGHNLNQATANGANRLCV